MLGLFISTYYDHHFIYFTYFILKNGKKIKIQFRYILAIITFAISLIHGQEVHFPPVLLSEVSNRVVINNIPNSIDTANLIVKKGDWQETFYSKVKNNEAVIEVILPQSGEYSFLLYEGTVDSISIEALPGWLSIVPPLLAIFLALLLRQVIVALFSGIYVGLLFIYDFNPFIALLRLIDSNLFNVLIDPDHMYIILFTLLIGGVVGIISKNGGTIGLANKITRFASTPKSGMISSWAMGLIIFFDDYANSLIIGNMMRPITDRLRISREKLAYIVDSTAAPIACLVIISTWIGYELGLISEGLKLIGSEQNPYEIFLQSLPYRFYPIAAIVFVFLTSYMKRDFGPMYRAEMTCRQNDIIQLNDEKSQKYENKRDSKIENSKWFNGAIPILIILFGTVAGLAYTGIMSIHEKGLESYGLQEIIKYSDSYKALLWSSLIAGIVAIILSVMQRIIKLDTAIKAWQSGIQSMLIAVVILVLAWGISAITKELRTADYIISILSDSISARFLPTIVFISSAMISFATGTSWGTMAIVTPIVIPMAYTISSIDGLNTIDTELILVCVVSSVLAGAVWGDHCSPIADTTILSSMSSKCDHIAHVKTQLPYAVLVGIVVLILGILPASFGLNPYISLIMIIGFLIGILLLIGKKTD